MNLPNKLTVMRILLTPLFMASLMYNFGLPYNLNYIIALIIFVVASLTDMFDGKIARRDNLITNFGKFLDPLADKMLTTSALIGFIYIDMGKIAWSAQAAWIVFIVLFREFLIASLRLVVVSSQQSRVIAANIWGKLKTVSQMIAIIYTIIALFFVNLPALNIPEIFVDCIIPISAMFLLWISTIFAVISGVIYMLENKNFVDPSK